LLEVYRRMGVETNEDEIIRANAIYYLGRSLPETIIAYPGFAYMRYFKSPWGMTHWEASGEQGKRYGGLIDQINDSKHYVLNTWLVLSKNNGK